MTDARRVNKTSFETAAVRVVEIETASLDGGLHAFRTVSRFEQIDADGVREAADGVVRQGFVDDDNLRALMENSAFESFRPYQMPDGRRLVPLLAADEVFEVARNEGNPISYTKLYERLTAERKLLMSNKIPLVDGVASGLGMENILFLSIDDHGLVDVRGRPIPQAMRFDYMDGCFDEEHYDLEALARALSAHPEIEILTDGRRNSLISAIPYYNVREGREEQVQFIWRPTDASWDDLLSRMGFDADVPHHIRLHAETLIRELDFFGTEQFRRDATVGVEP